MVGQEREMGEQTAMAERGSKLLLSSSKRENQRKRGVAPFQVTKEKVGFLGFLLAFFFSKFFSATIPLNPPFHCRLIFIGEVWLGHNHISPSTLFFIYFEFILKRKNTNVDSIRKISDRKINTLKVERVRNIFENLNSSEMTLKMLKTMQI
jgi:hypothetical protein